MNANGAHRITELLDHLTMDIKGSCFPLICHHCDLHSVQDKQWLFLAASVVLRGESWQTLHLKRRGLIFNHLFEGQPTTKHHWLNGQLCKQSHPITSYCLIYQKSHRVTDTSNSGNLSLFFFLLQLCHVPFCHLYNSCHDFCPSARSLISHVPTLSVPRHTQNGQWLRPSAVGRHHANTLERNGWWIPGPSVPVHRDMYTGKAHAGRHACVLTCIVHKSRTRECK